MGIQAIASRVPRVYGRALLTAMVALLLTSTFAQTADARTVGCVSYPERTDPANGRITSVEVVRGATIGDAGVRLLLTSAGVRLASTRSGAESIALWVSRFYQWAPASCRRFSDLWWNTGRMASEIAFHASVFQDPDITLTTYPSRRDPQQWLWTFWR